MIRLGIVRGEVIGMDVLMILLMLLMFLVIRSMCLGMRWMVMDITSLMMVIMSTLLVLKLVRGIHILESVEVTSSSIMKFA